MPKLQTVVDCRTKRLAEQVATELNFPSTSAWLHVVVSNAIDKHLQQPSPRRKSASLVADTSTEVVTLPDSIS